jgi:hypothetical protein
VLSRSRFESAGSEDVAGDLSRGAGGKGRRGGRIGNVIYICLAVCDLCVLHYCSAAGSGLSIF